MNVAGLKHLLTGSMPMSDKRNKLRVLLCVLIAVIIMVVLLLLLRQCNCSSDTDTTQTTTAESANTLPALEFGDSNGREGFGGDATGMKLTATSGFVFVANQIDQDAKFVNSADNPYPFKVTLYLSDGTIVYESGYVYPDDCISKIRLNQRLSTGVYKKALMVYRIYSPDLQKAISQYEFPIEIKAK